jgi:hypothetical protein
MQLTYVKKLNSLGISVERYVHNNDFFYKSIADYHKYWVDIKAGILGNMLLGNFLLNARADFVQSYNYNYQYIPIPSDPPSPFDPGRMVFNFSGSFGVQYRF